MKNIILKSIFVFATIVSVTSCKVSNSIKNENGIQAKEIATIQKKLTQAYENDLKWSRTLSNKDIFSKEIIELNRKCDSVTQASIEIIQKSDFPTDKPLIREGSQLTISYEGITNFDINEIKKEKDTYIVYVTLSDHRYDLNETWNDKIVFINENGLKIDNIYFNNTSTTSSSETENLKEKLLLFINQKLH